MFVYVSKECHDNLLFFADLSKQAKFGISGKLELTPIVTTFEANFSVSLQVMACCIRRLQI
jgi:hypothetical protein